MPLPRHVPLVLVLLRLVYYCACRQDLLDDPKRAQSFILHLPLQIIYPTLEIYTSINCLFNHENLMKHSKCTFSR